MNSTTLYKDSALRLVLRLSLPSMGAQISSVIMQFIDSAMVGHLDTDAAAAVGLVGGVTWLCGGLCSALTAGFTVQAAQSAGAGKEIDARKIMHLGLLSALVLSCSMALLGLCLSDFLPIWLRADNSIHKLSIRYFNIYALSIPLIQLNGYSAGMLQSAGNMRTPGICTIAMYAMNILFNFLLIFPSRTVDLCGNTLFIPGAGLGVTGAALGTALAETVAALFLLYKLLISESSMRLRSGEAFLLPDLKYVLFRAAKIGLPIALEQIVMRFAQLTVVGMIAPLGNAAMAAHSLAITAESFCYMPAYGIGLAQPAITGRSIGSGDKKRTRELGQAGIRLGIWITVILAVIMFCCASQLMRLLTPNAELIQIGAILLRIEAFGVTLYAVHLVCAGILQGRGDTFISSIMVLGCLWGIRVPISMLLIPYMGVSGAWAAMSLELSIRGIIFLLRFRFSNR